MNQQQRDYLVEKIEETFKKQLDDLEETLPAQPTLNRYLIGAFLDGSVKILDAKKIKENLTRYIKNLGSEDFVQEETYSRRGYYNSKKKRYVYDDSDEDLEPGTIKIDPTLIMEMPEAYAKEYAMWKKKKQEHDKKIKDLANQREVLILKIKLGTGAILDKLITQVDSLGELDLFSNKLTLLAQSVEEEQKQLTNKRHKL